MELMDQFFKQLPALRCARRNVEGAATSDRLVSWNEGWTSRRGHVVAIVGDVAHVQPVTGLVTIPEPVEIPARRLTLTDETAPRSGFGLWYARQTGLTGNAVDTRGEP